MEPNHNNYGPPAELPQPIESPGQDVSEERLPATPEVRGMQDPNTGAPAGQSSVPIIPIPQSVQPVGGVAAQPSADPNSTASLMADDADLIEKEWVIKAKSIVMQTKDDPYNQNREMSKVKADYLKKRYNKDLKVSEN